MHATTAPPTRTTPAPPIGSRPLAGLGGGGGRQHRAGGAGRRRWRSTIGPYLPKAAGFILINHRDA
ncbi:hypothetical protein [Streptacidiphilus sp. EB103A]|uniref:hypothetical protein n=1 Tax=Streptacidiphilus sp. EB103A TaxID=3156275 RepID=UPI00351512AA